MVEIMVNLWQVVRVKEFQMEMHCIIEDHILNIQTMLEVEVAYIRSKWKPGVNDNATRKRIRRLQRQLNVKIENGSVPRSKNTCSKIG
jgi:hypothetical protein